MTGNKFPTRVIEVLPLQRLPARALGVAGHNLQMSYARDSACLIYMPTCNLVPVTDNIPAGLG